MRRRILAAVAALVLLLVGAGVLLAYVRGADARALAGARTVDVLVVVEPIPAGTPAEQLADLVSSEPVPAKAAVPGRVTALSDLAGQVATVDLQPGEQLIAGRFAAPDDVRGPGIVEVPAGLQEVSVLLDPQRAVGGRLTAGDTVGVLVSLSDARTHAVLHQVLVTQVQGAPVAAPAAEGTQTASSGAGPAPTSSLMVTLAVTAAQAEAVVFGMEHGALWLSLEPAEADTSGTEVVDPTVIYGKDFS
ncbi:Flp pilus assembly protein CpaB [Blastococcus atacamensis]|uniref:Flp pilus assembly protein CpaB n=1 Tax=Blastococcus atacamensis TaxID=2070508 RepID=UPI000CECC668|nr:RcpC/CpaB family pilus assembly protein [Blastococcus atacamensis]